MRRIHLIGAAAALLVLAVAVAAYAVPSSQTTFEFTSTAAPRNAGTKEKPQAERFKLTLEGGTTTGSGSPQTSTDVVIQLPGTLKWYGGKWPNSRRCDAARAELADSDSVCPRGSRIGSGDVTATNQSDPTKPKIEEKIELTAYVLKAGPNPDTTQPRIRGGSLGLWLEGTTPVAFTTMLAGRISRNNTRISVHIPNNVQEPIPGAPTGIELLEFTLNGKTTVNTAGAAVRRTYGAISSVGCKRRRWKTVVTNIYRDGRKTDDDTSRCRK